jgi:glucosamine--fructose-6-phosphate aminotransferase (isomerizing)
MARRAEEARRVVPGELFLAEIHEQPAALRALLDAEDALAEAGRALAERAPRVVRLVGHGSSDNAATYAVYAFGLLAGWSALRDSISLTVYYGADLPFADSAVIALSQSGRTPDVVAYVERVRARGALTIAVTNDPSSDLAAASDVVLPLRAGAERAVAATKTYTNQLAAVALLAACAVDQRRAMIDALYAVAERAEQSLPQLADDARRLAAPFTFVGRMVVIGRGVELATAREIALKLTETCRVAAEPMTTTELAHGPVTALDPLFPVWAIATDDATLPTMEAVLERARATGATVLASGCAAERLGVATYTFSTPAPPRFELAPLLSVLPGQLFSWALARAKGLDPDSPEHLSKVTVAP